MAVYQTFLQMLVATNAPCSPMVDIVISYSFKSHSVSGCDKLGSHNS